MIIRSTPPLSSLKNYYHRLTLFLHFPLSALPSPHHSFCNDIPHGQSSTDVPHGQSCTDVPHGESCNDAPHRESCTDISHGESCTDISRGESCTLTVCSYNKLLV